MEAAKKNPQEAVAKTIGIRSADSREWKRRRHIGRHHCPSEEMDEGQEVDASAATCSCARSRQVKHRRAEILLLTLETDALQTVKDGINAKVPSIEVGICTDATTDTPFSQFDRKFSVNSMIQGRIAFFFHISS